MRNTASPTENDRLELVAEIVRTCRRARDLGLPITGVSRVLREAVHYWWERRGGPKHACATRRSMTAADPATPRDALVYEHAVPMALVQERLLALDAVDAASVGAVLHTLVLPVLVTRADDEKLRRAGLQSRMPNDWDGSDALARYAAAGVVLAPALRPAPGEAPPAAGGACTPEAITTTLLGEQDTHEAALAGKLGRSSEAVRSMFFRLDTALDGLGVRLSKQAVSKDGEWSGRSYYVDGRCVGRVDVKGDWLRIRVGKAAYARAPEVLRGPYAQDDWIVLRPEHEVVGTTFTVEVARAEMR